MSALASRTRQDAYSDVRLREIDRLGRMHDREGSRVFLAAFEGLSHTQPARVVNPPKAQRASLPAAPDRIAGGIRTSPMTGFPRSARLRPAPPARKRSTKRAWPGSARPARRIIKHAST